jgi:hypothetical protein
LDLHLQLPEASLREIAAKSRQCPGGAGRCRELNWNLPLGLRLVATSAKTVLDAPAVPSSGPKAQPKTLPVEQVRWCQDDAGTADWAAGIHFCRHRGRLRVAPTLLFDTHPLGHRAKTL